MKIVAIIPAYNCEYSIESVVRNSLLHCNYVIVVDDGSTDNTSEIATKAGAIIKSLHTNQGKAEALKQGINLAIFTGFDLLVTIDGDGEHDPSDIPILLNPIIKQSYSVVFGVREKTHGSCLAKNVRPTQSLLNKHFKVNILDAMCGFRAYSYAAISKLIKLTRVNGFGIDLELALLTKILKLGFAEVSISTTELKEYGGIRASHFDGLIENFDRFMTISNTYKEMLNELTVRINNRDDFNILINDKKICFQYNEMDNFYYMV